MKAKPEIVDESDPVKVLDVYILQEHLLAATLGIGDPRKDSRIHFLGGIRGVGALSKWVDTKIGKLRFQCMQHH